MVSNQFNVAHHAGNIWKYYVVLSLENVSGAFVTCDYECVIDESRAQGFYAVYVYGNREFRNDIIQFGFHIRVLYIKRYGPRT